MQPLALRPARLATTTSLHDPHKVDLAQAPMEPGLRQTRTGRSDTPPRSELEALHVFLNRQSTELQKAPHQPDAPARPHTPAKRKELAIIVDENRGKKHKSRLCRFELPPPSSSHVQTLRAHAEEERTQAAAHHPIAAREKFTAEFASARSGFDQMHRTLAHMDAAAATWESAADHFEAAQRQAHGLNLPQPSAASLAHPIDQCRANIARLDIKANLLKGVHCLMDHAAKLQMYTVWAAKKAAATPEGAFQMGHRARYQEYPGAYEETARYLNQALKICQSYDHATLPLTLFPIQSFDNELRHVAQRAEHLLDRLDRQDPDVLPSRALAHLACLQDWTPRFKQSCHDLMRTAQALKDALHGTVAPTPAGPSDPLIQSLHALTLTDPVPQEATPPFDPHFAPPQPMRAPSVHLDPAEELAESLGPDQEKFEASRAAIIHDLDRADAVATLIRRGPPVGATEPAWKTHCQELANWQETLATYEMCAAGIEQLRGIQDAAKALHSPSADVDLQARIDRGIEATLEALGATAETAVNALLRDQCPPDSQPIVIRLTQFGELGTQLRESTRGAASTLVKGPIELCAAFEQGLHVIHAASITPDMSAARTHELAAQIKTAAHGLYKAAKAAEGRDPQTHDFLLHTVNFWLRARQDLFEARTALETQELADLQARTQQDLSVAMTHTTTALQTLQEISCGEPLSEAWMAASHGTPGAPSDAPNPHEESITCLRQIAKDARAQRENALRSLKDPEKLMQDRDDYRLLTLRFFETATSIYAETIGSAHQLAQLLRQAPSARRKEVADRFADRFTALRTLSALAHDEHLKTSAIPSNAISQDILTAFMSALHRSEQLAESTRTTIQALGLLFQNQHEAQATLQKIVAGSMTYHRAIQVTEPRCKQLGDSLGSTQRNDLNQLDQLKREPPSDAQKAAILQLQSIMQGRSYLTLRANLERHTIHSKFLLAWIARELDAAKSGAPISPDAASLCEKLKAHLSKDNQLVLRQRTAWGLRPQAARALIDTSVQLIRQLDAAKENIQLTTEAQHSR